MRTIIFCEGTTDLLMIQFILQYRYGWRYDGFVENTVTNKLLKRKLVKGNSYLEINSCGGIMNIPSELYKLKDKLQLATKNEELFDRVIVMIDHDTVNSNEEFIGQINFKLDTDYVVSQINLEVGWTIDNPIIGKINISLFVKSIPEEETGAIETVMLKALETDSVEAGLIADATVFVNDIASKQSRYLQKKSRVSKAIFNTYFAIRTPEEKYDERARILKAYDWENNEVINGSFSFLDVD